MQTLIFLLIAFLMVIAAILLYMKNKHARVDKLNSGECPACGEKTRVFTDETTKTTFKVDVIKARVLKNHGCAGIQEIEYKCSSCGLKEVHPQS